MLPGGAPSTSVQSLLPGVNNLDYAALAAEAASLVERLQLLAAAEAQSANGATMSSSTASQESSTVLVDAATGTDLSGDDLDRWEAAEAQVPAAEEYLMELKSELQAAERACSEADEAVSSLEADARRHTNSLEAAQAAVEM